LVEAEAARRAKEDRAAGREPFSLPEATNKWKGALRLTQSLQAPQQVALSQSIISTDHALTLIDDLAQRGLFDIGCGVSIEDACQDAVVKYKAGMKAVAERTHCHAAPKD
jgi:hypothetical protein